MKPYSLLIFDWDGTLMDSAAHITHCMRNAIAYVGAEPRTDIQIRDIIGLGLEEAVQQLYPTASANIWRDIVHEYRQEFLVRSTQGSELFAGARDTLDTLQQQGYDLAIATGKSRRGLDKVLTETGLAPYFHITRCADETRSKPHPQMLAEILTDFNAQPQEALMIGDSEYDLLMANNIKMDALAVSYGVHSLQRLLQYQPRGYVHSLADIPHWLKQNKSK
ncbi:MAG: HAD-IIIA family hydrolase [Candidatus Thiocaldithrix dubininis]|uniref:HAD-IIIA family hydrolase n=1 Tax=Candidatus Thiocaldithrix dubininis TaxID=3080823 RepID=A0AA95KGE8_9GAMM|nr:MAG: HAD-IIIA family hydrolase [Candidatus Thiocaldithrix dubininis]